MLTLAAWVATQLVQQIYSYQYLDKADFGRYQWSLGELVIYEYALMIDRLTLSTFNVVNRMVEL